MTSILPQVLHSTVQKRKLSTGRRSSAIPDDAACVAGVAIAGTAVTAGLVRREAAWVEAGGTVVVASSESGVYAVDCERLAGISRIVGIVAVSARNPVADHPCPWRSAEPWSEL